MFELDSVEQALQSAERTLILRDNQRLTIWMPPQEEKDYIIGVDPAGGGVGWRLRVCQVIDLENRLAVRRTARAFSSAGAGSEAGRSSGMNTGRLCSPWNETIMATPCWLDLRSLDYCELYKSAVSTAG